METSQKPKPRDSKGMLWTGRVISTLCILFLLFDSIAKIIRAEPSVKGTVSLDFADQIVVPLGVVILLFTVLYAIPRTAILGAILLTAHLGGAVAIFIQKFYGHLSFLFPLIFCMLLWTGLFLRNKNLRALVPFERNESAPIIKK